MNKISIAFCLFAGFACCSEISLAEEISMEERFRRLEARVEELEKKVCEQDKCIKEQNQCIVEHRQKISEYEALISKLDQRLPKQTGPASIITEGFRIGAWTTMVVQGTNNTNATETTKESRLDASYTADITIEKEFKEAGGLAYLHLSAGKSEGLNNELRLYSNVNDDAKDDENVGVTEFYYEQKLLSDKAVLTFGKLDPLSFFDNNAAANDETSQFLAHMFVNNPAIEFSDNSAGIRLGYSPKEWVEFEYGVLNAEDDWEKIGDNLFNIAEVNFKPGFFGLEGNYRFIAWYNDAYHTKWSSPEENKEPGYGFALSFDQKINEIATLFCRYGWQNPGVYNPDATAAGGVNYSLNQAWSTGLQLEGKPWGRRKDVLAFAVGQNIPSGEYRKAGADLDPARLARTEGRFETYYKIQLNDHLSFSPDFQYIWNPFGKDIADDKENIFIYGLRTQVDF